MFILSDKPPFRQVALLAVLLLLAGWSGSVWQQSLLDWQGDLQLRLRGPRLLASDYLIIYINTDDINALGGWPVSRDYYGYATHILSQSGAGSIGFDILFAGADERFAEYDRQFGDFIRESGRVCLPMAFSGLSALSGNQPPIAHSPLLPLPVLGRSAAASGFSNLGDEAVIRSVPVAVRFGDTLVTSFGVHLAALAAPESGNEAHREAIMPLPANGWLRLNHFGGWDQVHKIGFVDMLQQYQQHPDSLRRQISGRIALITVVYPGVGKLVATPLEKELPPALLHLTVAENLRDGTFLSVPSPAVQMVLLAIVLLSATLALLSPSRLLQRTVPLLLAILLPATAIVLFGNHHAASAIARPVLGISCGAILLPVIYPLLSLLILSGAAALFRQQYQTARVADLNQRLRDIIREKRQQLEQTRNDLQEIRQEWQSESSQSSDLAGQMQQQQEQLVRLEKEIRDLTSTLQPGEPAAGSSFPEMIAAADSPMTGIMQLVGKLKQSDLPVLIVGETGTGKELLARAIHKSSERAAKPFIALNCGALPESLLDSELFGHQKGSFTGAIQDRHGRFELADGGTLFLDEITETGHAFQTRLLRVLQEGIFERIGATSSIRVDVRIIAACNRPVEELVAKGSFRQDLYYRLNAFPLTLPPLRERRGDIPLLVSHFLRKHAPERQAAFSEDAMEKLMHYYWPGNVRELENTIQRALVLAGNSNNLIRSGHLPPEMLQGGRLTVTDSGFISLEDQILQNLRRRQFSRSSIIETARQLGNRDRGTITEYLRGMCFRALVAQQFDSRQAAEELAGSSDGLTIGRVHSKIEEYIKNLYPLPAADLPVEERIAHRIYKGLPKIYHDYLNEVLLYLRSRQ